MNKGKPGRPSVDTPEVRKKMEEATALDATIEEICYYADISKPAYYAILGRDPEFSARLDSLRNRPVLAARQTVIKSLTTPSGAQWYLQRKRKVEFSERQEVTGADGERLVGITDPIVDDITKQLNELYKRTGGRGDGTPTSTLGS